VAPVAKPYIFAIYCKNKVAKFLQFAINFAKIVAIVSYKLDFCNCNKKLQIAKIIVAIVAKMIAKILQLFSFFAKFLQLTDEFLQKFAKIRLQTFKK
jgi:hypothetical protein